MFQICQSRSVQLMMGLVLQRLHNLTPSPPLPSHFLQTVEFTQILSLSQISSDSLLLSIAFRTKPKSPASSNLLLRVSPALKVTRCPELSGERNKNSSLEPTLPGIPPGTPKSFLRCSVALQVLLRSVYPPHQFCALKNPCLGRWTFSCSSPLLPRRTSAGYYVALY